MKGTYENEMRGWQRGLCETSPRDIAGAGTMRRAKAAMRRRLAKKQARAAAVRRRQLGGGDHG